MATLTKSRYLYGMQCLKRLWIDEHAPERLAEASPGEQRIMEQGIEVGKKAREYFPGGILVNIQDFDSAAWQTQQLIRDGAACIFEAAFILDGLKVRCDVIQKQTDNSWKIVEVKSSTKVKDEHLPDLAFQHHVLSNLGVPVAGFEILHINSECVYPDLPDLYRSEDVTSQVVALQEETTRDIASFINALNLDAEPEVLIGRHCIKPDVCLAKESCWAGVPVQSIFTIPNLSEEKIKYLVSSNCISINELPADYPLSEKQRAYVEGVLTGEKKIDRKAIREVLSGYDYPIHFLDFETLNPAIPRFDGMNPFEKFPFQYSLHVWRENGTVDHFEYLHMEKTDPRSPLLESLLNRVAEHGSVVVYHAPFERGVLARLAEYAPHSAPALKSIINRLKDQKDIFKNHYNHPGFLGSLSLKSVLPVIVLSLGYKSLNVSGGSDAGAVWERMINSTEEVGKSQMAADLKAYCAMDTLAMVEIHKTLLKL